MTSLGLAGKLAHGRLPLYKQVEAYVRKQIRQGEWPAGHKLDLDELARQTHISRPVVQQALQSLSSQGVLVRRPRSGTYVADQAPEQMRSTQPNGTSNSLALVVPHIHIPEFARLAQGVADAARTRGLDLLIAGTDNSVELYEQMVNRHLKSPAYGLIIVPPFDEVLPIALLQEMEAAQIPIVYCYRRSGDERWPVVVEDGAHAGEIAAEHLVQTGRRRLCFVGEDRSPSSSSPSYSFAYEGFARGALRLVRDVDEVQDLRVRVHFDLHKWDRNDDVLPSIRRFLEANPKLDGFFCQSDFLADAVYHVLCDLGRSVPNDAAVVGNGDFLEYAGYARQGLTTIAYSYQQIGEELLNQVLLMREGKRAQSYEPILIRGELRVRDSSAPIEQ